MIVWLAWTLAWLLGVFRQTGEAGLYPESGYEVLSVAALVCVLWCWLVQRQPPASRVKTLPMLRWVWPCLGVLAMALIGWASTGWRASARMKEALPDAWVGRDLQVLVQVEGLPQPVPGGVLLDARVLKWLGAAERDTAPAWQKSGRLPVHLSLHMPLPGGELPQSGQQWQFTVQLHAPDGLSNPGGYDGTLSYFERGVRAVGSLRQKGRAAQMVSERPEHPWQGLIDRWRQRIRTVIFQRVSDQRAAGILAGLSVGDQSAIEQDDWDLFRQTGIAHLVSISGAHIAMFGWMAALLVRRVWSSWPRGMHRWPAPDVAMWVALVASSLYALLSGWGVPAQRTVLMMAVVCCLRAGGRRWPWPLVCLISAVALTAMDPWSIRQVGFWLSYMAVAVLLSYGLKESAGMTGAAPLEPGASEGKSGGTRLYRYVLSWSRRLWEGCINLLRIQCLITLALMPLSLVVFQQASISSLLANLIAIPVFTIGITPLSLLGAIWAPCWDLGVWLINGLMSLLADLVRVWPAMAASPVLPWWVALCCVLAGAALALPMHWRWRLGLLPFGLSLFHLPQSWHMVPAPRAGVFSLVAADVGQGTAVLVRTARHALLFDTGPRV
ncbi:MAG: DUF4131 domain-containing protein, partial [Aquabacterium sp.]|uniref:ComEC/Rec2 family competence protein n=1 Tax=Aquabacterium sp. TaxID=1872578 RepID=UPI00121E1A19